MSDQEIFGPLITGSDVADAIEDTLQLWMEEYLQWVQRAKVLPFRLPPPRSYVKTTDFDHFPEDQLPSILIIHGSVRHPKMDGAKLYRATFPIRVGIYVSGRDRDTSETLAELYGAGLRALLLHKGSLGGFAVQTCWEGEDYGTHQLDTAQRTIGTAAVDLGVEVRQIVRRLSGPASVRPQQNVPPPDWPVVTKETPVVLVPE